MSIPASSTSTEQASSAAPVVPGQHPTWCDRGHNPDYPVHTCDVGEQDIPLGDGGIDLSVSLYQDCDRPAQVWLCEHSHDNTAVTTLTAGQAEELGWRLIQAAGLLSGRAPDQDRIDLLSGRLDRQLVEWRRVGGAR